MKGISPVIATILILLLAVAAVGGFWVWYQRQQTAIGGSSEETLKEQLNQQAVTSLSLASIYKSGGKLSLIINNLASVDVNVTGFRIKEGSSPSSVNTSFTQTLTTKKSTVLNTLVTCTSGNTLKIQLYSAGVNTPEFTETCP